MIPLLRVATQSDSPMGKPVSSGQDIHRLPGGCPWAGISRLLALSTGLP